MELYILRHADAEELGGAIRSDSERPLTAKGKKQARYVAEGLRALEVAFDAILASPYVRAMQTAEIVTDLLKLSDKLQSAFDLAPDGDPRKLMSELKKRRAASVLLVGHEPYLSQLISVLLSGRPNLSIKMKKAALCKLEIASPCFDECATLEWLMTPRQLAQMP